MKPKQLPFTFDHNLNPPEPSQSTLRIEEFVDNLKDSDVLSELERRRPMLANQYLTKMREDLIDILNWEEE